MKLTTPTSGETAEQNHGSVTITSSYTITLNSGGSSAGNNFAQVDYGALGGLVFLDINDNGVVVGQARDASGRWRAFRWIPGSSQLEDLGDLGGGQSGAQAINADGTIVGWSYLPGGAERAFVWNPTTRRMSALGLLPGNSSAVAEDINDHGVIVGVSNDGVRNHAVRWTPAP